MHDQPVARLCPPEVAMSRTPHLAALLVLPVLLGGCMTTRTVQTTTWADPEAGWERPGRVEWIRETVTRTEGDPAGGAVAGAIVGGILGSALGGHWHYDRWGHAVHHGSGPGALFGAVGGAMVGAAASQGATEDRRYEVFVRFNDGGERTFVYHGVPPLRVGDDVLLTDRGLLRWRDARSG
jgi:outer membrane lipoprotein SlyB